MTFDFFNTSNLAFGGKLTTAFKQLFNQVEQAEDNIDSVIEKQSIYTDYLFKNYIVGQPTNATNPCRSNEILNLVKDVNDVLRVDISYNRGADYVSDTLTINANVYDKTLNIVSKITANKTLTQDDWGFNPGTNLIFSGPLKYYLFFKPALSNMQMITENRLSKENDPQEGEELLFKIYIYPEENKCRYTISKLNSRYSVLTGDLSGYKSMKVIQAGLKEGNFNYLVDSSNELKFSINKNMILGIQLVSNIIIKVSGNVRYNTTTPEETTIRTYSFIPVKEGDIIEVDKSANPLFSKSNLYKVVYNED